MRKKHRNIELDHSHLCYKPCGFSKNELEKIELLEEEMEAIRLSDYEGLYQEECAKKMEISRTTFSRILASAHKKIADGFLNTKAIRIVK
jgi:predicted DNA-binding protein (UPF0251 family)